MTLQQVDSDDRSDDSIFGEEIRWACCLVFCGCVCCCVCVVVVVVLHLCEAINVFSDHIHMASCVLAQKFFTAG